MSHRYNNWRRGPDKMLTNSLGQVEQFEVGGDDWELYTERLEQFFVANEVREGSKKVAVLLTVIGAKAYALLRNLTTPEKPAQKSFDKLVKTMRVHLQPKPLVIAERFKFHQRTQSEDETVSQYIAKLRNLAEGCDFKNYLEEPLRDQLVCGIKNESIQRRLSSEEGFGNRK